MAYTYGSVTKCKVGNGTTRNEYECRLGYQVNSQSIADNTSNVTLRLEVRSTSSSYATYGYNQTTTIDGTSLSAKSFDMRSTNTWQVFGSRTITIKHNTDGSYSASKTGSFTTNATGTYSLKSGSASVTVAPAKIPRYGTANQNLNYKTETTINMIWWSDSVVDYLWYSVNNGSTWTGVDVTDGQSGTYNITGLTHNTSYNIKTRIRRKDSQLTTDSTALNVTTYKAPVSSLASRTETSITVNWSCDSTADYIWYSKDNGKTWTELGGVNTTSGSYTISGLSSNTYYEIKTRVRRKATQSIFDSNSFGASTYNYPYITKVGTTDLTIGNSQTLTLYNPLSRSVSIKMFKNNTSGTELYSGTTTGTTITFTPTANTLYASIPDSSSGKAVYYLSYSDKKTYVTTGDYTYKIKGTEKPIFTNFTYKDTNTSVSNILGSDQYLVKGLSNLQVTISSANKMVGQNSATPKNYIATLDTLNTNANYSTNDVTLDLGKPTSAGTKRLTITAYDKRNLYTSVHKDITIIDYKKPIINANITRRNNFESESTLKISGTFSTVAINNENKNSITKVQYKYRETGGEWSSWIYPNATITNDTFTCNDIILSLDNTKSFDLEVIVTDKLGQIQVESIHLNSGEAIFFISTNKKLCYQNGKVFKGSIEISNEEPSNNEDIWIRKGKNLFNGKYLNKYQYNSSTGALETTTTSMYCSAEKINIPLNTQKLIASKNGSAIYVRYFFYDSDETFISTTATQTGVSVPSGAKYITFHCTYDSVSSDFSNIQIETIPTNLNTATDYEEYVERTIYVNNGKGEYEEIYMTTNSIVYSYTEQKIGKWVNNKPIYRKTFKIVPSGDTSSNEVNISTLNLEELINIYGTTVNGNYKRTIFNSYAYSGSVSEFSGAYINGTKLIFRHYKLDLEYVNITLEYTKTTD